MWQGAENSIYTSCFHPDQQTRFKLTNMHNKLLEILKLELTSATAIILVHVSAVY